MDELTREELISIILELRERVAALEEENAELRAKLGMGGSSKLSTPEWIKQNRQQRRESERQERKKRKQSFVREWVESIRAIYKVTKKIARRGFTAEIRMRLRQELESRLLALADPYLTDKNAPQNVLAKRIEKHLGELFTFVQYAGCPSGNNAAERALRPAVIARKVSGGTRSANGSQTRTTLMSVFGTWTVQGKDLLKACTNMIVHPVTPAASHA